MLSKAALSTFFFWVFGMTWPGNEPSLLDHWWTLYSLDLWPSTNYIYIYIYIYIYVEYWPPTRLGCQNRKCTFINNRCIRSRNIKILKPWPWMGWMSAKLWRSQEEEWASNYYITRVKTGSQSVWRSDYLVRRCWNENMSQRGWTPRPPVEQPRRTGKKHKWP